MWTHQTRSNKHTNKHTTGNVIFLHLPQLHRFSSGKVGSIVSTFGVYVNFGCEKDGKLSVPQTDWKKYRVGDKVDRMVVNKVNVEAWPADSCSRERRKKLSWLTCCWLQEGRP